MPWRLLGLGTDFLGSVSPMVLNAAPPNERNSLALPQTSVPLRFDSAEVDEENFAVIGSDPSIALVVLEPPDGSRASDAVQIGTSDIEIWRHG